MTSINLRSGISRIVSLDGGGLYGLTSALWLKQLCQRDESFLSPGDVQLFAGCSAGALNALLLAREDNPREFLLAGGLEKFWRQPGTFSNSNPVTGYLSLWQIGAWLGAEDFLQLLRAYFGDMTLGDLRNNVLITSFNWTGDPARCGPTAPPGPGPWGCPPGIDPLNPWGTMAAGGWCSPPGWCCPPPPNPADVVGSGTSWWRPKFFKNFPATEEDRACRVVDVAYAAGSPPGLRAVLNGFGDGGTFNACPAANAVTAVIAEERRNNSCPPDAPADEVLDIEAVVVKKVCRSLKMLSLGVGARRAAYWVKLIDTSFTQFSIYPTSPPAGNWYPPNVSVGLDAPTEDAVFMSQQLLSPSKFQRLNPPLLEVPTLVACIYARFPLVREWLTQQIYAAVETPLSKQAVERALAFLETAWREDCTAAGAG